MSKTVLIQTIQFSIERIFALNKRHHLYNVWIQMKFCYVIHPIVPQNIRGVTAIVVGNGHGDASSNPGRG